MPDFEQTIFPSVGNVVFRKTKENFGGLSNMAGSYPVWVNRTRILTTEHLYQSCRFPHNPEVQTKILAEKSPMAAKMTSKPYRKLTREDWETAKVEIMRWCLNLKLAQNWNTFRPLLLETGTKLIVEESPKDPFWGAKLHFNGVLFGQNMLGKLLMELRERVQTEPEASLRTVNVPSLPDFLFLGQPVEARKAA